MGPDDERDRPEPRDAMGGADEHARNMLLSNPTARRLRRFWRMMPGAPRCKMCTSPFGPPIGPALRLLGKGRWHGNPAYCSGCFRELYTHRMGAEVECTLFFADIRGSTGLAETLPLPEFRRLLDRFYATATALLVKHEAIVDKYVGDEVVGIFIPALAGQDHARQAITTGIELLEATGRGGTSGAARIPIGIGVHTGTAYVGAVGTAEHVEFTALGDAVNVTARLASAAGAGELLLTETAAHAAQLSASDAEHRSLNLRGKSVVTDVFVIRSAADIRVPSL